MRVCHNLILLLLCITFFSACSTMKQSQTTRKPAAPSRDDQDIAFIDGISIHQNGHSTKQKSQGYESPAPLVATPDINASTLQQKYASILEVPTGEIDNEQLFSFIDSWWGTPYRYGGESRSGIDCSAFVQILYASVFGIASLPRTAEQQYKDSKKIKHINRLKEGDLVFFRIHSRRISHVGIYLKNNKFVHASFSSGVMISDLTDKYWKRYYAGGGEPLEAVKNEGLATSSP